MSDIDFNFPPLSLTWTGPSQHGEVPVTFLFGPTVTTDQIRTHLDSMGIIERGALLAIVIAIAEVAGDAR